MAINSHTVIFSSVKLISTHLLSFIINGSVLFHNEVTAYQKIKKIKKAKKKKAHMETKNSRPSCPLSYRFPKSSLWPLLFNCPQDEGNFPYIQTKSVLFKQSRIAWLWSKLGNRIGVDLYSTRCALNDQVPCHFTTNKVKVAAIRNTK